MMTTAKSPYRTRFHRDATVTVWNVYTQQWERTGRPSDRVLASMSEDERRRVIRHCGLDEGEVSETTKQATKSMVRDMEADGSKVVRHHGEIAHYSLRRPGQLAGGESTSESIADLYRWWQQNARGE